jgi:hypothetical protein
MSKSFFQEMERVIKARTPGQLETLMHYYAIPLKLYRQKKNKESQVYGTSAGSIEHVYVEIMGIVASDDFFESDSGYAGDFKQGFLYTKEKIEDFVGAYIEIDGQDMKIRRFKINNLKSIGTTTEILFRYEILSVAD